MSFKERIRTIDAASPDPRLLAEAAEMIRAGRLVIFPTSSFYGLGGDAFRPEVVERIFALKKRPRDKPLPVMIPPGYDSERIVKETSMMAQRLMETFWPGRLTLVLKSAAGLPELLTGGSQKIGIRQPAHPVAVQLVRLLGAPLTATSANISGSPGISAIGDLTDQVAEGVDLILDAGPLPGGSGSTVVDVTDDPPIILREGPVTSRSIYTLYRAFSGTE